MSRKKLCLLFYPGRLPNEYADADRISTYAGSAGLFVFGLLLFPSHRYFAFACASFLTFFLSRLVGMSWQDRRVEASETGGTVQKIAIILFVSLVSAALLAELYWTWMTGAPVFAMQSILGVAVLTFPLSRIRAKLLLGIIDVTLVIVSLVLYFVFGQIGFVAVGAFAALVAWALLLKEERAVH